MFQNLLGNKGFSLIDVLVVIAIITIAFVSLLGLITFSLQLLILTKQTIQANDIARETIEAVRNFRDGTNWNIDGLGSLPTNTDFHPEIINSEWKMVQGSETIGIFTRRVVFQNAYRDLNSNLVESGGNLDLDTKKITVEVSWQERGGIHKVEITTYLTNWRQ